MNQSRFLYRDIQKSFVDYLLRCRSIGCDVDLIAETAQQTIRYLRGSSKIRNQLRPNQVLEKRWYTSLERGEPDYSVYADDAYMGDLWAGWIVYTRRYLKGILNPKEYPPHGVLRAISPLTSIVDLGCGIAYSTVVFREVYPQARVICTNIEGIPQTHFCEAMADAYNFEIKYDVSQVGHCDLVFASEYFEHFQAPIAHLMEVIEHIRPNHLIFANTFGSPSIGHFDVYRVESKSYSGREVAGVFSNTLRDMGYYSQKTRLWNNRPQFWSRT